MKYLLTFYLIFLTLGGNTQVPNIISPLIPNEASSIAGFVPGNWEVIDLTAGPITQNGATNFAIVIRSKKPKTLIDTVCNSNEPFYPKMIIILSRAPKTNVYSRTGLGSNLFGTCNWGIQGQDPFDKILIEKELIGIQFVTGGTLRTRETFYFKYINNHWNLVKGKSVTYQQGDPETEVTIVNLLSKTKETYLTKEGRKSKIKIEKATFIIDTTLEGFDGNFPYEN
jgi:hypothetical protein